MHKPWQLFWGGWSLARLCNMWSRSVEPWGIFSIDMALGVLTCIWDASIPGGTGGCDEVGASSLLLLPLLLSFPCNTCLVHGVPISGYPTPHLSSVAVGGSSRGKCSDPKPCTSDVCPGGKDSPSLLSPCPPFPCLPCALPLCRLLANGVELARVLSINGAEYKQNKAFISRAVISLLIYFTVHRLFICFHVFSAGVICSSE